MTAQPSPDPRSLYTVVEIMAKLRGPNGCPWDQKQTHQTLKPYLLEETYETLEALDNGNPDAIKEELGDLLLQVLFHAQIASEAGHFDFGEVCHTLAEKLIHRHPHVFHPESLARPVQNATEVVEQWDRLKRQETPEGDQPISALTGIPKTSPALDRAYHMQKRAARVGFDWHTIEPVLEKFREELEEMSLAVGNFTRNREHPPQIQPTGHPEHIEAELGDVLFSLVNVARFLHVNPEEALRKTTNRFQRRFRHVEQQAAAHGKHLQDCTLEEMDQWWETAKRQEPPFPRSRPEQEEPAT